MTSNLMYSGRLWLGTMKRMSDDEQAYLVDLGLRIRDTRQKQKLGLDGLAELAEVHRTHLWKIEKGLLNTGLLTYVRIAEALDVPLAVLLPATRLLKPSPQKKEE